MANMQFVTILITFTCLTVASAVYRHNLRRRAQERQSFPKDLRSPAQNINSNLQIPNKKFCSEMRLRQAEHYLVLPWWYDFCSRLVEANQKNGPYSLPVYRAVLDKLHRYKENERKKRYN